MLPLIVLAKDPKKVEQYITAIRQEKDIPAHAVFNITPLKKELGIDQIRILKKSLIVSHKQPQLFILHSFHTATTEAQNALLKTLEEHSDRHLFLLIAHFIGPVLPTVISRSQIIVLDQELTSSPLTFMSNLTTATNYSFLAHPDLQSLDAEKAEDILKYLSLYIKKVYRNKVYYPKIMRKILSSYQVLHNNNANPQLLIDSLLIYLHKTIALDQNR